VRSRPPVDANIDLDEARKQYEHDVRCAVAADEASSLSLEQWSAIIHNNYDWCCFWAHRSYDEAAREKYAQTAALIEEESDKLLARALETNERIEKRRALPE